MRTTRAPSARCASASSSSARSTRTSATSSAIRVAIKEASPTSSVKKGSVATAVIIRTGNPIRRADGSTVHFDQNACVLVDSKLNPIGTRVFGPVARELRDKNYMKILSMAPEVV